MVFVSPFLDFSCASHRSRFLSIKFEERIKEAVPNFKSFRGEVQCILQKSEEKNSSFSLLLAKEQVRRPKKATKKYSTYFCLFTTYGHCFVILILARKR